jgi:molybdopterin-guanine dinucleotide biosynthesis protein A
MGRDKCFLMARGIPLWRLQLEKLRGLCREVIVCGKPSQQGAIGGSGERFEMDAASGLGPLSGIVRALECSRFRRVLALAVDMPRMTETYLSRLLDLSSDECGVVAEGESGFEGLCAVYPVAILPLARELLADRSRSLQRLVVLGRECGLLHSLPVLAQERGLFVNWNYPGDIQDF